MGFSDAVRTCLKQKYATFQGRASRSEYWWFMTFYFLVIAVAGLFAALVIQMGDQGSSTMMIIGSLPAIIVVLGLLIPTLAATVRRLHDRNMSGWWVLGFAVLGAIPFVGIIVSIGSLVIYCLKGTEGPNRFGRDPLGSDTSADVFA